MFHSKNSLKLMWNVKILHWRTIKKVSESASELNITTLFAINCSHYLLQHKLKNIMKSTNCKYIWKRYNKRYMIQREIQIFQIFFFSPPIFIFNLTLFLLIFENFMFQRKGGELNFIFCNLCHLKKCDASLTYKQIDILNF